MEQTSKVIRVITMLTFVIGVEVVGARENNHNMNTEYLQDNCNKTVYLTDKNASEVLVVLSSDSGSNQTDCLMTFVANTSQRLLFNVLHINMATCNDKLSLYGSNTSELIRHGVFEDQNFRTPLNKAILRFYCSDDVTQLSFKILVTAFHDVKSGHCIKDYNECDNSICIVQDLFCNNRDNCGDESDEKPLECDARAFATYTIVNIVISIIGVGIAVFICVFIKQRAKARRHQAIKSVVANNPPGVTEPYKLQSQTNFGFSGYTSPYQATPPQGFTTNSRPQSPSYGYSGNNVPHQSSQTFAMNSSQFQATAPAEYSKCDGFTFNPPSLSAYSNK